ncbi:MAG: hypothetical protein CL424_11960 [Acidimicrobiaceae bacterium]|nr:hypothetical protein [Acidimicrobiaceae bacterium]
MSRPTTPLVKDAVATLALGGYTVAVAVGFARVFSGWAFLPDFVLLALVGHGLSFALRRAGVSGWLAIPAQAAVLVWLLGLVYYGDTLTVLVPGGATWDAVDGQLTLVRDQFPTAVAPVLYDVVGWASLSALALVLVIVMSDAFAFRAQARGEALVPGGVLFVFIAALGDDRWRVASTALLVGTGVLAVVALRQLHDRDRSTVLSARRRSTSFAAPVALASALVIALLAGAIGPRIPGAGAEPIYETKGRSGTNLIDNPLVDIRSRLTNLGNVRLFRVNADQEAYWRLITLAAFDGQRFTLPASSLDEVDAPTSGDGTRIRQQVQILALQGDVVPAAADPIQASGTSGTEELRLRQQDDSSTLLAPQDFEPGDVFDIVSVAPDADPATLAAAGVENVPDDIYLELPDNLPDVLYAETERLTAGIASPYERALALQSWFRDPNEFTYSLEVQSGHDANAIESFFQVRAGYCEQFAATFAAMARAAGIPSRVAVGYTPGTQEEAGWFTVIGKNAHAWPELWFDGIGWVAFEPTPGRGAPGAESYTGVPAQQDETGTSGDGGGAADPLPGPDPTAPPTVVQNDTPTPSTTIRPVDPDAPPNTNAPFQSDDPDATGDPVPVDGTDEGGGFPWTSVVVLALVVLAVLAPAAIRHVRRFRSRSHGPREQVTAAWQRARAAAADAGVEGTPAMTPTEWTAATAVVMPVAARPMRSLAEVVDLVSFAPPGQLDIERRGTFGDSLADDCELWATQIGRITTDTLTTSQRVKRYFTDFR